MTCDDARALLHEDLRGRLKGPRKVDLDAHVEDCESCRRVLAEERTLDDALGTLPKYAASSKLREALEAQAKTDAPRPLSPPKRAARPGRRWVAGGAALVAIAAAVFLFVRFVLPMRADQTLVREAVNDHLRVLYSEHPIEIESGGIHQVKPWFAGRVDFAPTEVFGGDDEFPLEGGSVGYMIDRKAATFLYRHKLHTISLFVFPADGLPWPATTETLGRVRAHKETQRGFHVLTWRDGDLGYAVVSDVDEAELARLALRVLDPPP